MKGDFTRDTFDPSHHFSRVLMQQGRVTLDADHNEQTEILLHYVRTLARDLFGPHASPIDGGGFKLTADATGDLVLGAGHIYVDGMLVENDADCRYTEQPDFVVPADDPFAKASNNPGDATFFAYLDVWERHITALEDDSIREKALGGPDTCTRTKVVWQAHAFDVDAAYAAKRGQLEKQRSASTDPVETARLDDEIAALDAVVADIDKRKISAGTCEAPLSLLDAGSSSLAARVDPGANSDDACVVAPDSEYRGAENQLYRIEIHAGGDVGSATFKWSRDNGSVAAAWLGTSGNDVSVSSTRGFTAESWVELTDDTRELAGLPGALVKVVKVAPGVLTVESLAGADAYSASLRNPRVRQWSKMTNGAVALVNGALRVVETPSSAGPDDVSWIDLEDGVQVQFLEGGSYRTGDYWLVPARVATGSVEWPAEENGRPALRPSAGVSHHTAPLGFVWWTDKALVTRGCRCEFGPAVKCSATAAVKAKGPNDKDVAPLKPIAKPVE